MTYSFLRFASGEFSYEVNQFRVLSMIFQVDTPGEYLFSMSTKTRRLWGNAINTKSGRFADTSTSSIVNWVWRNSSITTASSSKGLSEHVEYTMRPPTASIWAARYAILPCSLCRPIPISGIQRRHRSTFLRRVPGNILVIFLVTLS